MATATIDGINGINLWGINVEIPHDNDTAIDKTAIDTNTKDVLNGTKYSELFDTVQTDLIRQELSDTIGKLGSDFIQGNDYVIYSNYGREVHLQSEVYRIAIRGVDRALNPQARAKTETRIVEGIIQTGQLDPFKIGKGGKRTLNVSSGKVAGLNAATWSKRAQKGRSVPRYIILDAAGRVSHQVWSYCLECVDSIRAFAIGFDIKTKLPSVWAYHIKVERITRWIYPEDNATKIILWAGIALNVGEHRSKGRNGTGKTTSYEDGFEPEDIAGNIVHSLGELNITEFVKGIYPRETIKKEYDDKEKARLRNINRTIEQKRIQAIEDIEDIKHAYLGNLTEKDMTENQLEFMKRLEQWRIKNAPNKEYFYPDNITHNSPEGLVYTVSEDTLREMCDIPLYGPHTLKKMREYGKAKQVRDSFLVYSSKEWNGGRCRNKLSVLMRAARIKALVGDILSVSNPDILPKLGQPENVNCASLFTKALPCRLRNHPDDFIGPIQRAIPQDSLNNLRHCAAFNRDVDPFEMSFSGIPFQGQSDSPLREWLRVFAR